MRILLLPLLLLVLISCSNHLTQSQDQQAYLKKLLEIHAMIKQKLNVIEQTAKSAVKESAGLQGSRDLQKSILLSAADAEREAISHAQQGAVLPLDQKTWQCNNYTQKQIDALKSKIQALNAEVKNLEGEIENLDQCEKNNELQNHLNYLKTHIGVLESEALANHCDPPKKELPIKLIPSLKPQNWIYDGMPRDQYADKIKQLQKNNTLVECPQEKPFVIEGKCGTCENQTQKFYSIKELKCKACPEKTKFEDHKCIMEEVKKKISVLGPQNPNYTYGDLTPEEYEDQVKKLEKEGAERCPEDKPFAGDNGTCITCRGLYDVSLKQCTDSCPSGKKFVVEKHQCLPLILVANPGNNNWIYGGINPQEYQKKLAELGKNNVVEHCPLDKPFPNEDGKCGVCDKLYDVSTAVCAQCPIPSRLNPNKHICEKVQVTCPSTHPFYNGDRCIQCAGTGQFDNFTRSCQCPLGTAYYEVTGYCYPNSPTIFNNNANVTNYQGQIPTFNPLVSSCPPSHPYFNGSSCISCELPHYFDFNHIRCFQCPYYHTFNETLRNCTESVNHINSNLNNAINFCCGFPVTYSGRETCPFEKPYFDGKQCIACAPPYYFNFTGDSCQRCAQDYVFNSAAKACLHEKHKDIVMVSTLGDQSQNYYGQPPTVSPEDGQYVHQCPEDHPFFNGEKCISCYLPAYFNFDSNLCEICPGRRKFNLTTRSCAEIVDQNQFNSNLGDAKNFIGPIPAYSSQKPSCPTPQPFFNGQHCIACQLPNYYSFFSSKCQGCGAQKRFNTEKQMCQYVHQQYITDTSNKNIFYNGNFDKLASKLQEQKQNNPKISRCHSSRPFYNSAKGKCIACPDEDPLFDIKYNRCIHCNGETEFEEKKHLCLNKAGIRPTLERMMMNTFGWV